MQKELEPEDTRFPRGEYSPIGLIICPTRELTIQVHEELEKLSSNIFPKIRIESLSHSKIPETLKEPIDTKIDIIIGTPGKILSHCHQRSKFLTHNHSDKEKGNYFQQQGIDLSWVKWTIIDECDKLLSMGFFPDIKDILTYLPRPRKNVPIITHSSSRTKEEKEGRKIITNIEDRMKVLLFTATLVPEINDLIKRIAPKHSTINLNPNVSLSSNENIDDVVHLVSNRRKYALLKYLLKRKGSIKYDKVLVFCRTQQRVERLKEQLENDHFKVNAIHKDLSSRQRFDILDSFKQNKYQVS